MISAWALLVTFGLGGFLAVVGAVIDSIQEVRGIPEDDRTGYMAGTPGVFLLLVGVVFVVLTILYRGLTGG